MNLNYYKKRKFNELIGSSINFNKNNSMDSYNVLKMLKLTKNTKHKNDESEDEEDGDDGDDGDNGSNPLGIPGLFAKQDDKYIYLKNNHLYFHREVSQDSVDEIKKLMRNYWNKFNKISKSETCIEFKPKPLYIHIFSSGGCAHSGFSLYDFIIEYKKKIPVYTIVEGSAASAATIISVAGTKRFITPNSSMLIHQLSTFFGGNYQQIEDEFENSKKCMEKIMEIYKTHTKISKKKLTEILKHDLYWDASQCVVNGLVDEIKLVDIFNDDDV